MNITKYSLICRVQTSKESNSIKKLWQHLLLLNYRQLQPLNFNRFAITMLSYKT